MENKILNWKVGEKSEKDFIRKKTFVGVLPPKVWLNSAAHLDQLDLGSCTANAASVAVQIVLLKEKSTIFSLSRLLLYYETRKIEGTIKEDAGAFIANVFRAIKKSGICPEFLWDYSNPTKRFAKKPPKKAYDIAKFHREIQYERVMQTLDELKATVAEGYPIIFGFLVYQNFMTDEVANTGIMPPPQGKTLGGHAVCIVGYDDEKQCFRVQNSWGSHWGKQGDFYMPYDFALSANCDDFFSIKFIK